MIRQLTIKNYALIDELEISFSEGMTIITGETGAGKSILLGALSLLLGNRADPNVLYSKDKKCIIEGEFITEGYHLDELFDSNDLDLETRTIIRREIGRDGKSRAFVNDTPVNLAVLRDLGSKLIEVHSQHETLTLNDSVFQMMVVDSSAGDQELLASYKNAFSKYVQTVKHLEQLREVEAKAAADQDYYRFQFDEISSAGFVPDEQTDLEQELEILNNSEGIMSALSRATSILNGDGDNLIQGVSSVISSLQPVAGFHPGINEILTRLKSVQIELKDISSETENMENSVSVNPARAEVINDRLDLIYKLEQKHRVQTLEELISLANEINSKLQTFNSLGDEISKLEKECAVQFKQVQDLALQLRKIRTKAAPDIEKKVQSLLSELGMKHAILKIELKALPEGQFKENGADTVRFLFGANKGVEYRELDKVASGGELSRLMLSIKSMLASLKGLPTIIFDEIDTGISGEIAHKVGNILKRMSSERQVIAITHLPQMAGKGDVHLFVFKKVIENRTVTRIRTLSRQDRVEEIARMLSGEKPTAAAMANAEELLGAE